MMVATAALAVTACARSSEPVRFGVVLPTDFAQPALLAADEATAQNWLAQLQGGADFAGAGGGETVAARVLHDGQAVEVEPTNDS